jgi:hypothetical protein
MGKVRTALVSAAAVPTCGVRVAILAGSHYLLIRLVEREGLEPSTPAL